MLLTSNTLCHFSFNTLYGAIRYAIAPYGLRDVEYGTSSWFNYFQNNPEAIMQLFGVPPDADFGRGY
jgi:hypothetical protein